MELVASCNSQRWRDGNALLLRQTPKLNEAKKQMEKIFAIYLPEVLGEQSNLVLYFHLDLDKYLLASCRFTDSVYITGGIM